MTREKLVTHSTAVAMMLPVPLVMVLVYVTRGAIEPHLPGQRDTWNIQYTLHLVVALVAAFLAFRHRGTIGRVWCWIVLAWNGLLAAVAVYAIVSLWGDMY